MTRLRDEPARPAVEHGCLVPRAIGPSARRFADSVRCKNGPPPPVFHRRGWLIRSSRTWPRFLLFTSSSGCLTFVSAAAAHCPNVPCVNPYVGFSPVGPKRRDKSARQAHPHVELNPPSADRKARGPADHSL